MVRVNQDSTYLAVLTLITILSTIAVTHLNPLSEYATPFSNGHPHEPKQINAPSSLHNKTLNIRIAVVRPDFTATAYSSFYSFYSNHMGTQPGQIVKTDLRLLNASISNGWAWSLGLYQFLTSKGAATEGLLLGQNLFIVPETNVSQGGLFRPDGQRNYDAVILGFIEYVTASEYQYYKTFVATGGVLVELDATNFLAEVRYYPSTQHIALVRGHGWSFNGTAAWRDIFDRWKTENTNWTGGTFAVGSSSGIRYSGAIPFDNNPIGRILRQKYGQRVFTTYHGHEENTVSNMTRTSIIAHWLSNNLAPHQQVSAYIHNYKKAYFIHFGAMGSDIIATDSSVQTFLTESLRVGENLKKTNSTISFCNQPFSIRLYSNPQKGTIAISSEPYANQATATYNYEQTSISANPPPGYTFHQWNTTGGLAVIDSHLNPDSIIMTCSGTVTAVFQSQQLNNVFSLPTNSVDILALTITVTSLLLLRNGLRRMRHLFPDNP